MASVIPPSARTGTVRFQIYAPQGLAQAFFAYLGREGLTVAAGGRRAIRTLVEGGTPTGEDVFDRIEARLAATLERDGGEFREAITEIRQMLAEIRALLRELAGQQ